DLHMVGPHGIESANGGRHHVVDDEVGKDQQVAIAVGDDIAALRPETRHDLLLQRLDLHFGAPAPARCPAPTGAAPGPPATRLGDGVVVAEVLDPASGIHGGEAGTVAGADVVEVGRVVRHAVIAVGRILLQQLPVGTDAVFLRAGHDLHAV